MALMNRKGNIILSGKDGRGFVKRMKQPDASIMEKRDKFINEAREKFDVVRDCKGKIILKVK